MIVYNGYDGFLRKGKRNSFILLPFFLFLFSFHNLSAQVTSSVDTTLIRIGEEIKYTIQVEADTTALVLFPEGQSFAPLETIESYKTDTTKQDSKYLLIKKYGITQFDSGTYKLPAQRVMIDDRIFTTDSALVEVRDVPVDTTKQKMFDIKPVIEVERPPFDFTKLLYVLIPLLVLGLIGYLLFRRKKRKEEREKQLPPYEEAMAALQELDTLELLKDNKSKAYYSSLTEIVKRYLDREVDSRALESTSDELIERLQLLKDAGHFDFDKETIQKLDAIFRRADLVKFAKMKEESGQARADRTSIEDIINETQEVIPEPTEEELLQNEVYLEELRKKQKRQKIKKTVGVAISVAIIALSVNIATQGWDSVRDSIFGNEMKKLAEGKWYVSEYGIPAVIVETPKVLERKEFVIPEETKGKMLSGDHFEYNDLDEDLLWISVMTFTYDREQVPEQENQLEVALESVLSGLEDDGAINMVVKKEEFSTENGINGLKAYGDFNMKNDQGKVFKEKLAYEMLAFSQNKGLQYIGVVYKKDDFDALTIKDRIINSVELEVDPFQQNKKEEE